MRIRKKKFKVDFNFVFLECSQTRAYSPCVLKVKFDLHAFAR